MRRYEGQTVKYTGFAIVAIESVWPNPKGDEVSPVEHFIEAEETEPQKSKVRDGLRPGKSTDERGYHSNLGYYKVLPLNILELGTDTSIEQEGSRFQVTFTQDDLLLTIPEGSEQVFRQATGLPINRNDLIESSLAGALPILVNNDEHNWEYVKDEELGLSRYRITGPYSSFNVEDLVEVNDTVTIWIYHDPSDFYLKDELGNGERIHQHNDEIKGIIGSGDRQSQTSTKEFSFDEKFLFDLGLVNKVITQAVSYDGDVGQIEAVTGENLGNIVNTLSSNAFTSTWMSGDSSRIAEYVDAVFPESSEPVREYIVHLLSVYEARGFVRKKEDGGYDINAPTSLEIKDRLSKVFDRLVVPDGVGLISMDEETAQELHELGFEDPDKFLAAVTTLKNAINEKAQSYANEYARKNKTEEVIHTFATGRKVLVNSLHGETPYLALKGTISSVSRSDGISQSTITISGEGLEKVLTSNQVFYDDLILGPAAVQAQYDFNALYAYMSPSRAVQHIISRWAARQLGMGKAGGLAASFLNEWFVLNPLPGEGEEGDIDESIRYDSDLVVVRGFGLYSTHSLVTGEGFGESENVPHGDSEAMRVFTPINYLDATRIQEFTAASDDTFRVSEGEGVILAGQWLQSKESIMGNLRRIGGTSTFYEMFVDEAGKFRYRLSYEAMERTPNTAYTPIIQDYDILESGATFTVSDNRLSTVVDVKPSFGYSVTAPLPSLAYSGRGTYAPGGLPLESDLGAPDESLAPEFFRYGMRYLELADLYQDQTAGAQRKALVYHGFYGTPIKTGTVRIRNNTSYRVGETTLVMSQKSKRRSRSLIDLDKYIKWMEFLQKNPEEREMYIGVESRFLEEGKESFTLTASDDYLPIPDANEYQKFTQDPYKYVLDQFLLTFRYLKGVLPGVGVITPEYFPTSYWYYEKMLGDVKNWDGNNFRPADIINLHTAALKSAVLGESSAEEQLEMLVRPDESSQGIINTLRFQDFRAASYYITGVSHKFSHGAEATTTLSLDFGQDTLVLLEPKNMLPIGFLSIEKKMKIGYDDSVQRSLWHEYTPESKEDGYSTLQRMYLNQFERDKEFKEASFLHNSQYLRNSSNYMYTIANTFESMASALDYAGSTPETVSTTSRETGTVAPVRDSSVFLYEDELVGDLGIVTKDPESRLKLSVNDGVVTILDTKLDKRVSFDIPEELLSGGTKEVDGMVIRDVEEYLTRLTQLKRIYEGSITNDPEISQKEVDEMDLSEDWARFLYQEGML